MTQSEVQEDMDLQGGTEFTASTDLIEVLGWQPGRTFSFYLKHIIWSSSFNT